MFFGRSRFHFVFIGAGSSVFTMRLIGDILHEDFIEGGSIRLVDIDEPVLERVTAAGGRIFVPVRALALTSLSAIQSGLVRLSAFCEQFRLHWK